MIPPAASAPPRDYRLLAELLGRALDAGAPMAVREVLTEAAEALGVIASLDDPEVQGTLDPAPGRCCVAFRTH